LLPFFPPPRIQPEDLESSTLSQLDPWRNPGRKRIFAQFGLSKMHFTATFSVIYVQRKWLLQKNYRPLCSRGPISRMGWMLQHPQHPLNLALNINYVCLFYFMLLCQATVTAECRYLRFGCILL